MDVGVLAHLYAFCVTLNLDIIIMLRKVNGRGSRQRRHQPNMARILSNFANDRASNNHWEVCLMFWLIIYLRVLY